MGANFEVGEKLVLAGWGGYSFVRGIADGDDNNPNGAVLSAGGSISLLDLIKEGSQLSIAGGVVPKFTADRDNDENQAALSETIEDTEGDSGDTARRYNVDEDPDTSFLLEALYKFPISDNILITPGVYAVFNPNHNENNDTVYVGSLRTTFKF